MAYGPTKAALINLAETLYLDLHPKGLGISLVNPGFVETPLTAQNQFKMPAQYMFKDIPDTGPGKATPAEFVHWTVEQMDRFNIGKALVGCNEDPVGAVSGGLKGFFDHDMLAGPDGGEAAMVARLATLLGPERADNAVAIDLEREGLRLGGLAGIPTYNRGIADHQFLFVNRRPVRDRLLVGAVRGAYQDLLARDRHPVVALYLTVPQDMVDVNVHPAKTEVRFRDAGMVRGMIVSGLRRALDAAGHRASSQASSAALGAFVPGVLPAVVPAAVAVTPPPAGLAEPPRLFSEFPPAFAAPQGETIPAPQAAAHPLGAARGQVANTYIVAETADALILVDQHAAHERLTLERMQAALGAGGVAAQALLMPQVVELDEIAAGRIADRAAELAELGLEVEPFGPAAVLVRAAPALRGAVDVTGLVRDLADDLAAWGRAVSLK
jgi:DNA mismatch repair protein MutL